MNLFVIFLVVISLAMALWLSRADWVKMLALVPLGALVPGFYGAAVNCGIGFLADILGDGACTGGATPRAAFAALYVISIPMVLAGGVVFKLIGLGLSRRRAA